MTSLKNSVISSVAWLAGMKYLGQVFSWVVTIVVIRILSPDDYGLMAMAGICVNFLMTISEMGLEAAIIQKDTIDRTQLSKLFGFFILSHTAIFIILFASAPLIADIFKEPRLTSLIRVLSFNFIIMALFIHQRAMVARAMKFKLKSVIEFTALIASSMTTLILAIKGFGVWALVFSTIMLNVLFLIGYSIFGKSAVWPSFNFHGIRDFVNFGGYSLSIRVLFYFYSKADVFWGARILGKQILGIYSVALDMVSIPMNRTMPIINQVAFPAYSKIQSDIPLVRQHFLKTMRLASLLVFPIFWGMASITPNFFGLILGEKWSATIVPIQLICMIMPLRAITTLISPMISGIGRIDVNFKFVIYAAILMPILFYFGAKNGILGLCLAWIVGYLIIFFITLLLALKEIQLSVPECLQNLWYPILPSMLMVFAILMIQQMLAILHFKIHALVLSFILIMLGATIYLAAIRLSHRDVLIEMIELIPLNRRMKTLILKFC